MKVTGLEPIIPTNMSQGIYLPQNPIGGLENPVITKKRGDKAGTNIITYSGDLTFTGADADFIKSWVIDHISATENFIIIYMDDECCGNIYKFMIRPDEVDFCYGECEISVTPKEYSVDNEIFKCLDSKPIFDDTFAAQQHPRMMFCKEIRPDWLQTVILILGVIFDIMLITFVPAMVVIQLIISIFAVVLFILTLGTIGTDIFVDSFIFDDFISWVGTLQKSIVGCGYKTPSPLVREYVGNGCNKCGAAFQSHIFTDSNSDYYNSVYMYSPTTPGLGVDDFNTYWMEENTPLESTIQFLDKLCEVFNGDYSINNGVLRFERKDWFDNLTPWLDLNTLPSEEIISECYSFNGDKKYAYANLRYSEDGYDAVGQEAMGFHFSDIVEWNSPPNPMQSGVFDKVFPFGPQRWRQDGIGKESQYDPPLDTDILGSFEWFIGYKQNILDSLDYMILSDGHTSLPKLVIWDENSGKQFAKAKRTWPGTNWPYYFDAGDGHGIFNYNYPYWMREDLPGYPAPMYPSCLNNSIYPGNLYNRFWYIENPRLSLYRLLDADIEVIWNCQTISNMDIDGTIRGRAYPNNIKIDEIVLDYGTHKMTIKGDL